MYDMNFPYRDLYEPIIMSGGSKMRKNTTVKRTLALTMAVLWEQAWLAAEAKVRVQVPR